MRVKPVITHAPVTQHETINQQLHDPTVNGPNVANNHIYFVAEAYLERFQLRLICSLLFVFPLWFVILLLCSHVPGSGTNVCRPLMLTPAFRAFLSCFAFGNNQMLL